MAFSLEPYNIRDDNRKMYGLLKERSQREMEGSITVVVQNGERLPENVIFEILSWLPVKDLLCFKSVCKLWYALISCPDFVSKHLRNYYDHNDGWRQCLLAQYFVSQGELVLYEFLLDDTPRVIAHQILGDLPLSGIRFLDGPCDGLYYVYDFDNNRRALWNPSLAEFKVFTPLITKPNLPSSLIYALGEVYGFGLDPLTKDYKVVIIKGYWSATDEEMFIDPPLSVLVYSLRTDCWKYCGDLARYYILERNLCYIYVDGRCYWFGSSGLENDDSEVIISFDMATDTFVEIYVPNYSQPSSKCLGVYDGHLAFLTLHIGKNFDVWTLIDGSWTTKLSVKLPSDIHKPIGHWKHNMLLFEWESQELVLFDYDTQELRNLAFFPLRCCEGIFSYMESLLSMKDIKPEVEIEQV